MENVCPCVLLKDELLTWLSRGCLVFVQKLSLGTLKKLGLHQAKARHIPLHLHARQLILPALGSRKEELSLVCKPPRFFVCSLRRLDLQMPSQDQNGDDEAGCEGAVKTAGWFGP